MSDSFEGELVEINADDIESFCRVVGIDGEAYKQTYKAGMEVPLDFSIKLSWKVRPCVRRLSPARARADSRSSPSRRAS